MSLNPLLPTLIAMSIPTKLGLNQFQIIILSKNKKINKIKSAQKLIKNLKKSTKLGLNKSQIMIFSNNKT